MGSWFAFVIDGVGSWRLTGGFGKETCAVKRHVSQIYNSTLLHHCLVSTFPHFLPSVFDKAKKKKKTLSYCLYSSWAAERSDARQGNGELSAPGGRHRFPERSAHGLVGWEKRWEGWQSGYLLVFMASKRGNPRRRASLEPPPRCE